MIHHSFLKSLLLAPAAALLLACTGGAKTEQPAGDNEPAAGQPTETTPEVKLEDGHLVYGQHDYRWDDGLLLDGDLPAAADGQSATLTFTHFPADVQEFETLQQQLLGRSMAGSLALNLLAYEMYRRNREAGETCLRLCNTETNASATIRMLGEKFSRERGGADSDTYHQPYLVASFLDGATQANGYQPNHPYTLHFYWATDPYSKQHERLNFSYGYAYRLYTERNGGQRCDATVLVPDEGDMVLAHTTASFYFAVPNIQHWDDRLE